MQHMLITYIFHNQHILLDILIIYVPYIEQKLIIYAHTLFYIEHICFHFHEMAPAIECDGRGSSVPRRAIPFRGDGDALT